MFVIVWCLALWLVCLYFSVIWSELLLVVLCCHQCTSAREWSVLSHLVWYVCDVLYAVLYICVNCFVLRGCEEVYINVCNSNVFSVLNM